MGLAAPELDPNQAAQALWRSVEDFGEEGSRKKERGIAKAILTP